jgi:hypothetical protein
MGRSCGQEGSAAVRYALWIFGLTLLLWGWGEASIPPTSVAGWIADLLFKVTLILFSYYLFSTLLTKFS